MKGKKKMRIQEMIDYTKVNFPELRENETIDQTKLLTLLANMYDLGFDNGYFTGYDAGVKYGYNNGYQDCFATGI